MLGSIEGYFFFTFLYHIKLYSCTDLICRMVFDEPIKISLQKNFQFEKLSRTIQQCNDISTLRQISKELLKLNKQQTGVISWLSMRALNSEGNKLSHSQLLTDL